MTAFTMHTISRAIEINVPSLTRAYNATIKELIDFYEKNDFMHKVLNFSGNEAEQVIIYEKLGLTLKGTYRFVFRDTKMFLKWTFNHTDNDEVQDVLIMLIDDDGLIYINDIDSKEVINYHDGNLPYNIFQRITKAAYDKKLFY
ncbi:hypothetical protein [Pantoea ananatis]|uniref:hypothetical protein n=1 Tax=Pantoea ananas TaxID=553 RepID=UPI000B7E4551|nr:hypothetical protein [Pantoea ananatis]